MKILIIALLILSTFEVNAQSQILVPLLPVVVKAVGDYSKNSGTKDNPDLKEKIANCHKKFDLVRNGVIFVERACNKIKE